LQDQPPDNTPRDPRYEEVLPAGAPVEGIEALPEAAQEIIEAEDELTVESPSPSHLTAWLFRRGQTPRRLAFDDLVPDPDGFLWIDASGYTVEELERLSLRLRLPRSLVDVALAPWQRPRVDLGDGLALLIATLPRIDAAAQRAYAAEYDLVVGPRFVLTIHRQPATFTEHVYRRAELNPDAVRDDPSFLLYVILDELLGYYGGLVEHVAEEIERIEERALVDSSDAFLADMLHAKRYVFALDHLAAQHRAIFAAILRPDFPFVDRDRMERHFRDLDSRLADLLATFAAAEDAVNGAFQIYVSHMAHRTNQIIRTLTLISGLFLPVSVLLTGFAAFAQVAPTYGRDLALLMLGLGFLAIVVALVIFHRAGWVTLHPARPFRQRRRRRGGSPRGSEAAATPPEAPRPA
jgi:magnesium transporter